MKLIAQYLEAGARTDPSAAALYLEKAAAILPLSALCIGWNLAPELIAAVSSVCASRSIPLYRWQPLFCPDGELMHEASWSCLGLAGKPVPGFAGIPEFTFSCPNNPDFRNALFAHIETIADSGHYAGFFLDRIRFPSPFAFPDADFSCFCPHCSDTFHLDTGYSASAVREGISAMLAKRETALVFVRALFDRSVPLSDDIRAFMDFRCSSVTTIVAELSQMLASKGLSAGLDCFTSSLAYGLGQDLSALCRIADWTKVMAYGHTFGVAGLPFELCGIAHWLMFRLGMTESSALDFLSQCTGLALPSTIAALRNPGIASLDLQREVARVHIAAPGKVWAGIELVDEGEITALCDTQIAADIAAFSNSGAEGLVLSWDLQHIPPERMAFVADILKNTR